MDNIESLLQVDIVEEENETEAPETIDITEDYVYTNTSNRNNSARQYTNTSKNFRTYNSRPFKSKINSDKPRYEMPPVLLLSSPECSPPNSPMSVTICSSPEVYAVSPSPPGSPSSVRLASPVQDSLGGPVSPGEQANDPLLSSCIPSEEDPADTLFGSSVPTESEYRSCLSGDNNEDSSPSVSEARGTDHLLGFPEPPDGEGEPLLSFSEPADNNFGSSLLDFQPITQNYSENSILGSPTSSKGSSKHPVSKNSSKPLPVSEQADDNEDDDSIAHNSVKVNSKKNDSRTHSTSVNPVNNNCESTRNKSSSVLNDSCMDQDVIRDPLADDFDMPDIVSSPEVVDDRDSPELTNNVDSPVTIENTAADDDDDISILEPSAENNTSVLKAADNQLSAQDPLSLEADSRPLSPKTGASSEDVDPLSTDTVNNSSSVPEVIQVEETISNDVDPLSSDIITKSPAIAETVANSDKFTPVVSEVFSMSGISFPASTTENDSTENTCTTSVPNEPITLSDSPTPVSALQVNTNSSTKKTSNKMAKSSLNKKTVSVPVTEPLSVRITASSDNSKSASSVESSSSPVQANSTGQQNLAPESPPSPGSMAIPNLSASNLSATYVSEAEKDFYKKMFKEFSEVKYIRLHCTICDKHIGCAANSKAFSHRILRVLVCKNCYLFYGSGEFQTSEEDGSDIFCRWCGQGGKVLCCSKCPNVFCQKCIRINFGTRELRLIKTLEEWNCFACDLEKIWEKRAVCYALVNYTNKIRKTQPRSVQMIDESVCCTQQNLDKMEEAAAEKRKKSKVECLSAGQKINDIGQKNNDIGQKINNSVPKINNTAPRTYSLLKVSNKQYQHSDINKALNQNWENQKRLLGSGLVKLLADDRNKDSDSVNVSSVSSTQPAATSASILSSALSTPTPLSTATKQPVIIRQSLPDPKLSFRNPMYRPNASQTASGKTLNISNCKIIGTVVPSSMGNVIVGNNMHNLVPSSSSSTVFRVAQNSNSPSVRVCYPGVGSISNKTVTVPRPMLSVPSSDNLGLRFQTQQKTTYNDVFAAKVLGTSGPTSIPTPRFTTLSGPKRSLSGLNVQRNPAYHTVQLSNGPVNSVQKTSSVPVRIVNTPSAKTVTSYTSTLAGGLTVPGTGVLSLAPNQLYAVDGGQIAIINDNSYQTAARKTVETGITQFMTGVAGQSATNNIQVTNNTPQSDIDIKHDWFRNCLEDGFSATGIVLSQLVTLGKSFYEAEVSGSVEDMKTITGKMHKLLSKASEKFGDIDKKLGRHFRTWDRKITRQSKLCKKLRVVQPEQQKNVSSEHSYSSSKPSGKSNTEVIEVTPDLLLPEGVLDIEKEDKVPEYSHNTPFLFESTKNSPSKEVDVSGTDTSSDVLEILDSDAEEDKENNDKTLDDKDCWPALEDCEDDTNIWDDSRKTSGSMNLQDIIKSSFSKAMKLKSENNKSKMKDFSIQADLRGVTRSLSTQTLISSPVRSSGSNSSQKRPLPSSNNSFFNPSPKKSVFTTNSVKRLISSSDYKNKVSSNVNIKKPVSTDDESDDDDVDIKEVPIVDSFKKNVYMNNIGLSVKKPVVLIKKIEDTKLLTLADRVKAGRRESLDSKTEKNISSSNSDLSDENKSVHRSQNVGLGKGIRIKITRERDMPSTSRETFLPPDGSDSRKRKREDSVSSTSSQVNGIDCISIYSDSGSESPAPKRVRFLDTPTKPCSVKLLKLKDNDLRALAAKNCIVKLEKLTSDTTSKSE